MISNPYQGIPTNISRTLENLILDGDHYHQTHKRRMARTLDLLLQDSPQGRLLELGTSKIIPLSLQDLAPDLEVHVTDFDLDQPVSGQAHLTLGNKSGQFPVYRVDLETQSIPVDDGTFDVVLCCEVIEHLEVDPMFMLSELNRILKPGGTLILTTPNITSTRAIWKILRGVEPYFYMQYRHTPALYRHNYEYSQYSLKQVIEAAGFTGQVWTEDSFEDPVLEDIVRLREIGYKLASVGDNLFCVAQKTQPVVNRYPEIIYAD